MHAHTPFAQYNKQLSTDLVFFTSPQTLTEEIQ